MFFLFGSFRCQEDKIRVGWFIFLSVCVDAEHDKRGNVHFPLIETCFSCHFPSGLDFFTCRAFLSIFENSIREV